MILRSHPGRAEVCVIAGGPIEVGFAREAPCLDCDFPLGAHAAVDLQGVLIERTAPVPKFLTKPREVHAEHFDGTRARAMAIQAEMPSGTCYYGEYQGAFVVSCRTANGNIAAAHAGDWVIKGKRECYPCTAEEFAERYDPVEPVVAADAAGA